MTGSERAGGRRLRALPLRRAREREGAKGWTTPPRAGRQREPDRVVQPSALFTPFIVTHRTNAAAGRWTRSSQPCAPAVTTRSCSPRRSCACSAIARSSRWTHRPCADHRRRAEPARQPVALPRAVLRHRDARRTDGRCPTVPTIAARARRAQLDRRRRLLLPDDDVARDRRGDGVPGSYTNVLGTNGQQIKQYGANAVTPPAMAICSSSASCSRSPGSVLVMKAAGRRLAGIRRRTAEGPGVEDLGRLRRAPAVRRPRLRSRRRGTALVLQPLARLGGRAGAERLVGRRLRALPRSHVHDNVCSGEAELFAWVMGWFARSSSGRPRSSARRSCCAVRQGTGKTIVGRIIGSLLGQHYALVATRATSSAASTRTWRTASSCSSTRRPGAAITPRRGSSRISITGEYQYIEYKGREPVRVKNYVRLLITGNNNWLVPAGLEERRFAVLDVGEGSARTRLLPGDRGRDGAGGREALLRYLLDFDLDRRAAAHDPVDRWRSPSRR
jgi:hypothetical protein